MRNLLQNAITYCDKIPVIKLATSEDATGWTITVNDNGPGIDPAASALIFEPFARPQQNANSEGSGLGLSICKKLLETMGGRIGFASNLGEGTTFSVFLPK